MSSIPQMQRRTLPASCYVIHLVVVCIPFLLLVWLPFYVNGMYKYHADDFNSVYLLRETNVYLYPPFSWSAGSSWFRHAAIVALVISPFLASVCSATIVWKLYYQWTILTRSAKALCLFSVIITMLMIFSDYKRMLFWLVE